MQFIKLILYLLLQEKQYNDSVLAHYNRIYLSYCEIKNALIPEKLVFTHKS